jgi:hypothetical protein
MRLNTLGTDFVAGGIPKIGILIFWHNIVLQMQNLS